MRLCLWLVLVTVVVAEGYPDRRAIDKQLAVQGRKDRVREAQRDCKGKCATNIAQKAAAEAKAAQAAQNAAGAQAAHMVSMLK